MACRRIKDWLEDTNQNAMREVVKELLHVFGAR
jgi:hypothetical protein